MQFNTVIITGAAGLIGSECVKVFSKISNKVIGIDCDKRSYLKMRQQKVSAIV